MSNPGNIAVRSNHGEQFEDLGWCVIEHDQALQDWTAMVLPAARRIVSDPANDQWLRCGGTWYAGVSVLTNSPDGSVEDGPALPGSTMGILAELTGLEKISLDRGQLSVCYPGYPLPMEGEPPAAFRYRKNRDAAHIDGLLPVGAARRRFLREYHAFILGIPLTHFDRGASPLVVWEGSHRLVRQFFSDTFEGRSLPEWENVDLTESYHALRNQIFDSCERVTVHASPGQAFLVHRLELHGVAPWEERASADSDGRMICYFRPEYSSPEEWLERP